MRRGVDTHVLVCAHVPSMDQHAAVRAFLLRQLSDPEVTIVVTPGVLHEFVHVVTDGRRFEPPVAMAEALAIARGYLGRSNVECVGTDEAAVVAAFALLEEHRLGRRRIADALLAATLLASGVPEIVTCDSESFESFEGITVVDPLEP